MDENSEKIAGIFNDIINIDEDVVLVALESVCLTLSGNIQMRFLHIVFGVALWYNCYNNIGLQGCVR